MRANMSEEELKLFLESEEELGRDIQFTIAIEEMSELIKVITKHKRGKYSEENYCEELAHVLFMCNQLIAILDIENGVNKEYIKSYDRLICEIYKERIRKEK